jgi:RNA polymerase sigma-70 factor (ECF subfamily)
MTEPDDALFDQWICQYRSFLYRAAWALTGDRSSAQDLVQETFSLAWQARKQLRDPAVVQAWLYRILKREAMRLWNDRRPLVSLDEAANETSFDDRGALDLRLDILSGLQEIGTAHREVLVLYYLSDLSYEQLALALDIPKGTVMSRLSRARNALRRTLEEGNGHE